MSSKLMNVYLRADGPIIIKKWKVKAGMTLAVRQIILLYENVNASAPNQVLKYKCNDVGTVKKVCAVENSVIKPGDLLLLLEECLHPTVMKDMCAECGADLRQSECAKINASVPMVHSIPELKVSEELAQTLGKADEVRLLKDRKLVLLVDLDQTLIHTTNDNIPPNLKDVVHFQLYGPRSPWYHTRIRPGTEKFLESVSALFELHICTFGARSYAHHIASYLDPNSRLFSHRILSRDECFDANSKMANLKALFPCGDDMVCIIDDREDVWNYAPNLIHVKPYHFFQHTGDINAPPGLTKKENDNTEDGFDFTSLGQEKPKGEAEGDKKISINKTKKTEPSGETTTDKDTEDEKELKPVKVNNSRKSGEFFPKPNSTLSDPTVPFEDEKKTEEEMEVLEEPDEKLTDDCGEPTVESLTVESEKPNNSEQGTDEKLPGVCGKPVDRSVVDKLKINSECETKPALKENSDSETKPALKENSDSEAKPTLEENSESDTKPPLKEKSESETKPALKENSESETKPALEENSQSETKPALSDELNKSEDTKELNTAEGNNENATGIEQNTHKETLPEDKAQEKEGPVEEPIVRTDVPPDKKERSNHEDDEMIEVEDTDDYLLHLEDILKMVHRRYYEEYDKSSSPLPDLKIVIPQVKRKVLAGCHLVFSGLVPSHVPLPRSKAYAVAQSLGATVSAEVTAETTHLVAARAGTAKVNSSRRQKGVHIVTPIWLWQCAERWEKVDERLYPLARGVVSSRHPPAHCGSPQHPAELETSAPGPRLRTDSGRFSDTINPLLTFSSEEMASMDQEVEDLCADDDDSESEAEIVIRAPVLPIVEPDSSTSDSMTGELPKGWEEDEKKAKKRKIDTTTCTESDLEDDSPSAKFRRGEPLPSDLDLGEDSQDDTQDSQEDGDDSAWTLMGAALEREFLSGD